MSLLLPSPQQLTRAAAELRGARREWLRIAADHERRSDSQSSKAKQEECRVCADDMEQVADWLDEQASRTDVP